MHEAGLLHILENTVLWHDIHFRSVYEVLEGLNTLDRLDKVEASASYGFGLFDASDTDDSETSRFSFGPQDLVYQKHVYLLSLRGMLQNALSQSHQLTDVSVREILPGSPNSNGIKGESSASGSTNVSVVGNLE